MGNIQRDVFPFRDMSRRRRESREVKTISMHQPASPHFRKFPANRIRVFFIKIPMPFRNLRIWAAGTNLRVKYIFHTMISFPVRNKRSDCNQDKTFVCICQPVQQDIVILSHFECHKNPSKAFPLPVYSLNSSPACADCCMLSETCGENAGMQE